MSSAENTLPTDSAEDQNIVRMYKKDDDGALVFREAWVDIATEDDESNYFVVNHGPVGHVSESKEAEVDSEEEARGMLAGFKEQCLEDGYTPLSRDDQSIVVAQFALKNDRVTDRDKYLEEKAVEAITAHLAWRGSGIVEKSEFGPGPHSTGKLNIYIVAPDAARAVANIKVAVREDKLDFTKLSIGVAPANDLGAIKAKHSPSGGTAFTL